MNYTITARKFKLPEDQKAYMEEKVQKLTRFYDNILNMEIILGWEKLMRYVELKISVNQKPIVIKETTDDLRKSFDLAMDKAERQLKKHKSRHQDTENDIIKSA